MFDKWSIVHISTGIVFGWLVNPILAVLIMTLWEPLEIFVISPLLAKVGIEFGYESLRNSLSDILFNTVGILLGATIMRFLIDRPFSVVF